MPAHAGLLPAGLVVTCDDGQQLVPLGDFPEEEMDWGPNGRSSVTKVLFPPWSASLIHFCPGPAEQARNKWVVRSRVVGVKE
jgi:hypothetical protein